jgi:hypothetical protein
MLEGVARTLPADVGARGEKSIARALFALLTGSVGYRLVRRKRRRYKPMVLRGFSCFNFCNNLYAPYHFLCSTHFIKSRSKHPMVLTAILAPVTLFKAQETFVS